MSSKALKTACGRGRQEFLNLSRSSGRSIRSFSTSEWHLAEQDAPPSGRARSQAAAGQLNSLGRAQRADSTPQVFDIRNIPLRDGSRGTPRPRGNGQQFSPRPSVMLGNSMGMQERSRGGERWGGRSPGSQRGGRGGPRGRGGLSRGRGGTSWRSGRGQGSRRRGGQKRGEEGEQQGEGGEEGHHKSEHEKRAAKEKEVDALVTPMNKAEYDFIDRRDRGVEHPFEPETTQDTLLGHGPAIPTSTSDLGPSEVIRQNLYSIGGSRPYVTEGNFHPKDIQKMLEGEHLVYFTDPKKKAEVEDWSTEQREKEWIMRGKQGTVQRRVIRGPDDKIKTAVMKGAIRGEYEEPRFVGIDDPVGQARMHNLRDPTYLPADINAFERTLKSLMTRGKPAPAQAPGTISQN